MTLQRATHQQLFDLSLVSINVLATVGIAYLCVKSVFLFIGEDGSASPPKYFGSAGRQVAAVDRRVSSVDAGAIPLWNLFGKEGESKRSAPQEIDAPKTQLQLELQGVFVAALEDASTAIIAERMQEAQLYRIGDKVPGNATLASVMSDRVLLNSSGRIEALYFPDAQRGGVGISSTRPHDVQTASLAPDGAGEGFDRSPNAGVSAGMPPPGEMAKALREEFSANPTQSLKDMGLEMNAGRGYRISDAGNPMFAALGARPGDLIISINGRPLGNIEADLAGIEALLGEGSLRVELERNGRRFSTEVPLP